MGQINITDIASNSAATANSVNTRIGKIVTLLNGNIDAANVKAASLTKALMAADVYGAIYPIGSVYINAQDGTNPATLFGFGTWEAFGAGRVPVGLDATQTEFDTVAETGGEKTHTLTTAELAAHSHGVNDPGHNHSFTRDPVVTSASGNSRAYLGGSGQQFAWSALGINGSGTGISIQNNGSGAAHNNLQPYVTVYMWKRVG